METELKVYVNKEIVTDKKGTEYTIVNAYLKLELANGKITKQKLHLSFEDQELLKDLID